MTEPRKRATKSAAKQTFEDVRQAIIDDIPALVKDSKAHRSTFVNQPDLYAAVKPVAAKHGASIWFGSAQVLTGESLDPVFVTISESREDKIGASTKGYSLPVMRQSLYMHAAGETRVIQEAIFVPTNRDDYGSWLTYSSRYMIAGAFMIELVLDDGDQPGEKNTAGKAKDFGVAAKPKPAPAAKKKAKPKPKPEQNGPMTLEDAAMAGAVFASLDTEDKDTGDAIAEAISAIRETAVDGNVRDEAGAKKIIAGLTKKFGKQAALKMLAYLYVSPDDPGAAITEAGIPLLRSFWNDGGFEYIQGAVASK